ncbi:hypothetical protein [Conexibacter sp. DBS9H8]|uniref:hypothetical protein n=1 Tax=Conexibacter sp. DBS9H8 TaxID=2937801 RepID=UPI00200BBA09|nr:hypothetical protein [Conexibacter sp. DBS9H8]
MLTQTDLAEYLILGPPGAVAELRRRVTASWEHDEGAAVVPWGADRASWLMLAELCHDLGCVPVPVHSGAHAAAVAHAYRRD